MPERNDSMIRAEVAELLAFDVAERARSEQDPWWRIARGELSPRDAVAERIERDGGDAELLQRQAELYAPPNPEVHQQALDELLARFFTETGGGREGEGVGGSSGVSTGDGDGVESEQGEGASEQDEEDEGAGEASEGPGEVVDLRSRRRRRVRVVIGSGLAAAAAAALVWALLPRGGPELPGEPLPGFASEWSNQYTGPMRGVEATPGCQRYEREGRLEVRLRPELALADDLVIAGLARSSGGEQRWLPIDPTLSDSGVITIDQSVDALGLTPGQWTLTFFISRDERLSERELAEMSSGDHPEIAVVRSDVCIEG